MKVIITGSTGMVGEGVLLECLQNDAVVEVLMVNRKPFPLKHPKLKELIVNDFLKIDEYGSQLGGFDACFYCAGVSSLGMNEVDYTRITYDTTMAFAKTLHVLNPEMVFDYVTGAQTDSTEKGKLMWARVKGKTENDLMKRPFKAVYNFRPGVMKPFPGQKNVKPIFKPLIGIIALLFPKSTLTLSEVGKAMIHSVVGSFPKHVLEISDIKALAKETSW